MGIHLHALRPKECSTIFSMAHGHGPLTTVCLSRQYPRCRPLQIWVQCPHKTGARRLSAIRSHHQFVQVSFWLAGDRFPWPGCNSTALQGSHHQGAYQALDIQGTTEEFIGMVNFYHRFVSAAANLMQLLFLALTVKPMELWWNEEMLTAFNFAKEAQATHICLRQGVQLLVSLAAEPPCCHIWIDTSIRHIAGKNTSGWCSVSYHHQCTIINAVKKLEHRVDFTAMAEAQRNDKEMAAYRTAISGLELQDIQFGPSDTMLLCNVSTCQPWPIIPATFSRTVFDLIHGLSHHSIWATQKLLMDTYVWHGIRKQVESWARTCKPRQVAKIHRQVKALMQTFRVPHWWFNLINIDIIGPLPSSQGYSHLLTMADQFTKWPEVISLKQTAGFHPGFFNWGGSSYSRQPDPLPNHYAGKEFDHTLSRGSESKGSGRRD